MDYYDHEEIASVTLFDVRVSESELMVFDSCIEYVVKHCPVEKLYDTTGCESKEELESFREDIIELLKKYVDKKWLPEKYHS